MDILYTCTLYPPSIGGAQIHLHCLAKQMQRLGRRVKVFTRCSSNRTDWLALSTYRPEPRREYVYEGIPVTQLGYPRSTSLRMLPWAWSYYGLMNAAVRNIASLLSSETPWPEGPLSLVHDSRVGREFLSRAALDFARRRQIPYILTANHHPRWHGMIYREYDRIYREADALIALTNAEKDLLVRQKGIPEERIHVTGIGPVLAERFSAQAFRTRFNLADKFVLYLGQQLKYKGVGAMLDAAPLVWRRHPKVQFVFIGPHSDYSRGLFEKGHDHRLLNLGSVDLETKTSAIAACEMLCLPSAQESFGGVFVEGWSHSKPVIGGNIPPIASVIDHEQNGLLVNQSPQEIADAIDRLLSDPDEAREMGQRGYNKVQANYTWARLAEQTLSIYQRLGAEAPASLISCASEALDAIEATSQELRR